MPIDPRIPLGIEAPPPIQFPDPGQSTFGAVRTAGALQQMQMLQREAQTQNALRSVLSQPGATDERGAPSQNAIRQVMAVDPAAGMKLMESSLRTQEASVRMEGAKSDLFAKKYSMINEALSPALVTYESALKSGIPEAQARERAQVAHTEAVNRIKASGMFSEDETGKMSPQFDPMRARSGAMKYTEWVAQQNKERDQTRQDDQLTETKRHARTTEGLTAAGQAIQRDQLKANAFNAPVEIESAEKDGSVKRVMAQQNKLTGQWFSADEKRTPIEGVRRVLTSSERAAGDSDALSPDDLKFMAKQYLAGDHSVLQNLGRGVQGSRNVVALRKSIKEEAEAAGKSPADVAIASAEFMGLKAAERTAGTRVANIEMAVSEAQKLSDLALDASEKFDRTSFTPLNRAVAMVESKTGGENIARFVAANTSFVNVYARAISPTGVPTVSDKEHAREMLNTAQTKEQYRAVIDQLKKEMAAAREAPADVKEGLRTGFGGTPAGQTAPPAPSTNAQIKTDAGGALPKVVTEADYNGLKSGQKFLDPDGNERTKR